MKFIKKDEYFLLRGVVYKADVPDVFGDIIPADVLASAVGKLQNKMMSDVHYDPIPIMWGANLTALPIGKVDSITWNINEKTLSITGKVFAEALDGKIGVVTSHPQDFCFGFFGNSKISKKNEDGRGETYLGLSISGILMSPAELCCHSQPGLEWLNPPDAEIIEDK